MNAADADHIIRAIAADLRAGRIASAQARAEAALGAGLRAPLVLQLAADARVARGRSEDAALLLEEAAAAAPADPGIRLSLGQALNGCGRLPAAAAAFDAALALRPDWPLAHFSLGQVVERLGDLQRARAAYLAATRDPAFAEPRAALAFLAVNNGQAAEARRWADEALALAPDYRAAKATLASADVLDGDYVSAEERLRALLAVEPPATSNHGALQKLLGDALHGQGRHGDAAVAYAAGGEALRAVYLRQTPTGEGLARRRAEALRAELAELPRDVWSAPPGPAETEPVRTHAFLVGFPRSGTTLLEQALARHDQVVGLEEKPTFADPLDGLVSGRMSLAEVAGLPQGRLADLRRLYWDRAAAFAGAPLAGRVLVDKMPLNILLLPLIQQLFPHARIILALRDPRDVVLSCFRQRFLLTPAMAEFTRLDRAAAYYDAVMGLGEDYRAVLPLPVHVHRYEDMVADFDGRVAELLGFLGLPWQDRVRAFGSGGDSLVNTPSARQIGRGLYTGGVGQWRRYAGAMAPALPVLAPWVERYGYPDD